MSTLLNPSTLGDPVRYLFARWRDDPGGTYQSWFLWEECLKNFRSIRRGITAVVAEIEAGNFGNVYKGSSLETVVRSIAEQRQIFKGADHAFLWKPKLRIPDIYENRENQLAFARFLQTCACCTAEAQGWLRDLGRALGFEVWVASNDRNRPYGGGRLSDDCRDCLPEAMENAPAVEAVRLIDVLWIEPATGRVAGFEVEHTTSIYSGIVRMLDLALGLPAQPAHALFLVAPDAREGDVRDQLLRPAFSRVADLNVRFIAYSELEAHRESIARFGQGMKAIEAIARRLK